MPPAVAAAYPFIDVVIDTSALQPVAQRSPGVIAVVGVSGSGSAAVNAPRPVETQEDVAAQFGATTPLGKSLALALLQDPKPSKIYGVKVGGTGTEGDFGSALDSLNAADDVNFVSLAGITAVPILMLLKSHVESNSAAGQKRLGVAMVDPATARTPTYVADVTTPREGLRSSSSRMVLVAARGAVADTPGAADVATAAMAAMAGFAPSTSILLKRVRGIAIPVEQQYSATEIKAMSEVGIIPIIQPSMIVGGGFYFGEGRAFTSDASQLYVDLVRTLDDIDFRLKAGLVGLVGEARITRAGLTLIKSTVEGILGPLKRGAVIDNFSISVPLLDVLAIPESARTSTDNNIVTTARANRSVDMLVSVTYGPAVHRLRVTLQPKF
jgi:hypothetical protein